MSDDKFGDDDDILDDDLDLEELDDLDDSAEDWDDFDDGIVEDLSEEPKAAPLASSEKTFLQKYFNFIVIGIVAVGAGLFGLAQFGGAPATDTPLQQQEETVEQGIELQSDELAAVEDLNSADMPPMPAPMDPVVEEAMNTTEMPESAPEDTGILTPMPALTSDAEEVATEELPALSLEIDPLPLEEPTLEEELALTEAEPNADVNADQDSVLPVIEETIPVEDNAESAFEETLTEPIIEEPAIAAPEPETEQIEEIQPIIANEEPVIEEAAPEAVVDNSAVYEAEITQKDEQIQGLEAELSTANQNISELKDTVKDLEAQMLKLTQDMAEKERIEAASTPAPIEKPIEKPEEVAPAPVEKAATPAPAKPKPAVTKTAASTWTLRSAQPGKAVIASKTTSDLRTVEVGNTVPGLGRITDISIVNGKWVVRGTQGSVSQ